MSLISIPNTFTVGAVIVASQHNSNFSVIYSDYNGNIDNTNLSASAAIADTKLAQITTAGKVSGASLTSLASIIAGAGIMPTANLGSGAASATTFLRGDQSYASSTAYIVVSFTRVGSTASGTQTISGVGFTPKAVILLAGFLGVPSDGGHGKMSIGFDDGTSPRCINGQSAGGSFTVNASTFSIAHIETTSNYNTGVISSFNSDGFVITWTKTGSPTDTITGYALALR